MLTPITVALYPPSQDIQVKSTLSHFRQMAACLPVEAQTTLFEYGIVNTEKLMAILPYNDTINTVDFSPDSQMIAGGSENGTIQVWDAGTGDTNLRV